jgi:hypothetical protein
MAAAEAPAPTANPRRDRIDAPQHSVHAAELSHPDHRASIPAREVRSKFKKCVAHTNHYQPMGWGWAGDLACCPARIDEAVGREVGRAIRTCDDRRQTYSLP